jgi:hypothetical protein
MSKSAREASAKVEMDKVRFHIFRLADYASQILRMTFTTYPFRLANSFPHKANGTGAPQTGVNGEGKDGEATLSRW